MSYKVKLTCLHFSLAAMALLICLTAFPQKPPQEPSPYNFDGLEQLFKQNQKTIGANFTAMIWKDGKVIYQKQGSQDFNARTQVPIGNAGNWMTAALVMTFVDEGKLSLDDKVSKYIPIFSTYMKSYITIRNCLTNTTGIRAAEDEVTKVMLRGKYATLGEQVEAYASKRDIATNPGTEFFYSNMGCDIAARVLEVITKKGFDRLMMERILRPLKMHGTTFVNDEGGAIDPTGGARSTADDYLNFLVMLLNKGQFGDKRVLSEKAVEELEKVQFADLPVKYVPKSIPRESRYALGAWVLDANAGQTGSMACPDLLGVTPYFDKCRKYAAVLVVGKPAEEQKNIGLSMKAIV
ncbi:MAG: serine hydrolase, partial [Bacteroidota bacterium]|nr:serine hydrolase [Bacteroidota bacterium]